MLMQAEGLWLNDKNAQPGMSNIDPLDQKKPKTNCRTSPSTAMVVKPVQSGSTRRSTIP
jgi:hypothetical protein